MKFNELTKKQRNDYRDWLEQRIVQSRSDDTVICPYCERLLSRKELKVKLTYSLVETKCLGCFKKFDLLVMKNWECHSRKKNSTVSDWLMEVK